MTLSGQFTDYSLPELFNTIEQGKMSGMLTIRVFDESLNTFTKKYLSFHKGCMISMSDDLMERDLVSLIRDHHYIGGQEIRTLIKMSEEFMLNVPLGEYLQSKNQINTAQLQTLFNEQVVQKALHLYELSEGWFTFNPRLRASMLAQTGLKIQPTELNLRGLRDLQKWDHFVDKFPEEDFALIQSSGFNSDGLALLDSLCAEDSNNVSPQLTPLEQQIFQRADGKTSLKAIAIDLKFEINVVQKVAFQLIFAGLVDELPMVVAQPQMPLRNSVVEIAPHIIPAPIIPVAKAASRPEQKVNSGFLENLSSFLKNRILAKS